jgi:hypothetical protein
MIVSLAYFPHDPAALVALAITVGIAVLLFFAGRSGKKVDHSHDES